MPSAVYTVAGMTCGTCVNAVSTEIGEVPGITGVRVDLATGRVTVNSDVEVDEAAVRAAVAVAGYEVVSS